MVARIRCEICGAESYGEYSISLACHGCITEANDRIAELEEKLTASMQMRKELVQIVIDLEHKMVMAGMANSA